MAFDGYRYHADRPSKPLDLVRKLRTADCRPCHSCEHIDECREREIAGLWVKCEMPERKLVRICIREGLVPADILAETAATVPADSGR